MGAIRETFLQSADNGYDMAQCNLKASLMRNMPQRYGHWRNPAVGFQLPWGRFHASCASNEGCLAWKRCRALDGNNKFVI